MILVGQEQPHASQQMNCRLPISLSVATLAAALFASPAPAQVRPGGMSGATPRANVSVRFGPRGGFGHQGHHRPFPGSDFLPPYYLYPDYDYDYPPVPTEGPAPPAGGIEAAQAPAATTAPAEPPLVIEYQGDQWVRVANYGQPPDRAQSAPPASVSASNSSSAARRRNEAVEPPPLLPPAVLVFRDGHQEELDRYMIMGSVIYTSADYWRTGKWTREVLIAELDVPATLKLNQERGGKLTLPAGPNEIVIRP